MKTENIVTICIYSETVKGLEESIQSKLKEYPNYNLVDIKHSSSMVAVPMSPNNPSMIRWDSFSALIILEKPVGL